MLTHNPLVFAYRTAPAEPEAPVTPAAPVADQPRQKRAYNKKKGKGCDLCGSKGPRHKLGCKLAGGKKKEGKGTPEYQRLTELENWRPPVTAEQFGLIRDCLYNEMSALEASGQMDVPLQQVNFVYQSKTYAQYEKLAREDAGMNG